MKKKSAIILAAGILSIPIFADNIYAQTKPSCEKEVAGILEVISEQEIANKSKSTIKFEGFMRAYKLPVDDQYINCVIQGVKTETNGKYNWVFDESTDKAQYYYLKRTGNIGL